MGPIEKAGTVDYGLSRGFRSLASGPDQDPAFR